MARDNKHQKMFMIGAAVLVVLAYGGLTLSEFLSARREAAALAAAWAVTGPPCPTANLAAAPPRSIDYEGVTFSRERSGGANYNVLEGGPAGMFITPGNVRVVTTAGTFDYAPGAGRSVTIRVRDGQPECVIGVNQAMFNLG